MPSDIMLTLIEVAAVAELFLQHLRHGAIGLYGFGFLDCPVKPDNGGFTTTLFFLLNTVPFGCLLIL